MRWYFYALVLAGPLTVPAAVAAAEEPFFAVQELFSGRRFPNVVVAADGAVLAFCGENGPVQVRRSEDGGKTWGPVIEVGGAQRHLGAALVDERSGDVLVFQSRSEELFRSRDHGKTWQREAVAVRPDGLGSVGSTHGAESGITLQFGTHRGRLLQPARAFPPGMNNDVKWWPYHYNTAIFSDDGGKTWQTSHPFPVLGTGEGALAELSDGTIYYNSRCHMADDAQRRIAWSRDGGETWINPEKCADLPDGMRGSPYGCMGGLVRLPLADADVLLYSNLDGEGGHGRGAGRERITVWASFDGGKTWPVKRLVDAGPSAYSSLAAGRPGTPGEGLVFLLYEGGPGGQYAAMQLARFNLAWVTEGRPWREIGGR